MTTNEQQVSFVRPTEDVSYIQPDDTTALRHIPLRNKELLAILDKYRVLSEDEDFRKHAHITAKNQLSRRDHWVGDKYIQDLMDGKAKMDGFPDCVVGYDMALHKQGLKPYEPTIPHEVRSKLTNDWGNIRQEVMEWLGAKYHALTAIYPPGGFISWHNNANAAGYNLIITYSETGDGWFDYIDPKTKKRMRVQDKPGWQCKAAYFGRFDEPDKVFWHAASTDCWRVTVSFVFWMDEASMAFRDDVIEEIMTE